MLNKGMFTSNTDQWATPQDFFDEVNKEFNFTLDVCADENNTKCKYFYSKEDDGLSKEWNGICWMNPPYGREIGKWIFKAFCEGKNGTVVVALLPARTDTIAFHKYIYKQPNTEIRLIKGRLIFGGDDYWKWRWEQEFIDGKKNSLYKKYGKKNSAPFPSMLVIFK